jgi:hypothetical protein
VGIALAAAGLLLLFREAQRRTRIEKPGPLLISVADIERGSYRLMHDLYGKAPNAEARRLLFMRKTDGALRAWYFPIRDRKPAAPEGDWFTPGNKCDPFVVDAKREEIRCIFTSASNQTIQLRWSWDGKSSSPLAPDMQPVPGKAEGDNFAFEPSSTILAKDPP